MAEAPSASEADKIVDGKPADDAASQDAKTDTTARSSGADDQTDGAKEPTSVLEAVKERLEADKAAESPPAKDGEKDADPKPAAEAKPEGEAEDKGEEDAEKDPPFHEHPRWQEMVKDRDGLKAQVDDLAPKAERFDHMQTQMRESDLSSAEVSAGFNIMALMKNDPRAALDALKPYYDSLLQVTGETLPDDLQDRIDAGRITEEDAHELSRARSASVTAERRETVVQERTDQNQVEQQQRDVQEDMATGVSEWEAAWKAGDPDYQQKQPFVLAKVHELRATSPPRNRAEATKLAQDALDDINKSIKVFVPRKEAVPAQPDGSSVSTVQAPKSSLEAANAALTAMTG